MQDKVRSLKIDLGTVDLIGVYGFSTDECLYADEELHTSHVARSVVRSMAENGCFDVCEFVFLIIEGGHYFLYKKEDYLVVAQLKQNIDINKVLLELKIKSFCTSLINS